MIALIVGVMYLYPQACFSAAMGCLLVGALVLTGAPVAAGQERPDTREQRRIDEANRREAAILVELVDRAEEGRAVPAGLELGWRHDFLKAEPGTFVPFVLTVAPAAEGESLAGQALMYVRAARRETGGRRVASDRRRPRPRYAFDAVFAVQLEAEPGQPARVMRGFAVPAGEYDVSVALRERPTAYPAGRSDQSGTVDEADGALKAGVMRQVIQVPDFWSGELTTSSVMLARRIRQLSRTLSADEALERPYAIGLNDVEVATDSTFPREGELIVVFVIYDPAVTSSGEFDVQVEYHVYQQSAPGGEVPAGVPPAREGERYVTRTNAQRFNARTLGRNVTVDAAHPLMAGQGILLSSFEAGEYRLGITVRDLLSGKMVQRDVTFTVEAAVESRARSAR
jgi:hypothetical protein